LKEKALDRTMWRVRFGRGFGPVVWQTTKWNDLWNTAPNLHEDVVHWLQQNFSSNRNRVHDAKYKPHYDFVCNIFGTVGLPRSSLPRKYKPHYDFVCNIFGTVGLPRSSLPRKVLFSAPKFTSGRFFLTICGLVRIFYYFLIS
jgi:hypothetical protein